jgi:hypothetical protein
MVSASWLRCGRRARSLWPRSGTCSATRGVMCAAVGAPGPAPRHGARGDERIPGRAALVRVLAIPE